MNYLALGDSISIDDYTGVPDGGAANQFARLIGATRFQNLTRDGRTTDGVLDALAQVKVTPDIVTLTAGGNDYLQNAYRITHPFGGPVGSSGSWDDVTSPPLENLRHIAERLAMFECPVILNTIYDPTDGDDALIASFGVGPGARGAYDTLNDGIRDIAKQHGFLLSDLQELFRGHGAVARETWIVSQIEPNHAGATAIARHWHGLAYIRARTPDASPLSTLMEKACQTPLTKIPACDIIHILTPAAPKLVRMEPEEVTKTCRPFLCRPLRPSEIISPCSF